METVFETMDSWEFEFYITTKSASISETSLFASFPLLGGGNGQEPALFARRC